ncbi:MAG: hypothetical protein Q4B69_03220 [Slackia sp.]|nr:hypothetical protein [Slackia sp.]
MSESEIALANPAESAMTAAERSEAQDPTYGISREEAAELRMLVSVERDNGDVTYAAFHSLCPTGEEFAFDDKACAIYRVLARRGMIEGADTENGFLFFNLAQEGRDASAAYDELHKNDEAETKAARPRFSFDRFSFDTTTVVTSAVVAAVVGLVAGILGTFIGNALM